MTNSEVVNAFVDVFLTSPELTEQALRIRLSATRYEVAFRKAGEVSHPDPYHNFPMETAGKEVPTA